MVSRTTNHYRWDDNYSVKIKDLDDQHKRLFAMIAELDSALQARHADSIIGELLENVIQYTISHFACEEELMQEHGFPGLAHHRDQHDALAQKLAKFNLSNMAGRSDIPLAFLTFLQAWWREHVLVVDQAYSDFLNARGVY